MSDVPRTGREAAAGQSRCGGNTAGRCTHNHLSRCDDEESDDVAVELPERYGARHQDNCGRVGRQCLEETEGEAGDLTLGE